MKCVSNQLARANLKLKTGVCRFRSVHGKLRRALKLKSFQGSVEA